MRNFESSSRKSLASILSTSLLFVLLLATHSTVAFVLPPTTTARKPLRNSILRIKQKRVELPGPDVENTDSNSNDDYSNVSAPVNQQESLSQRTRRPPREPDSPDRALSIVSELKANAALFAAFAYGGLSIPSLLTVTESKVTSVTTSISTARPLPGSDLVHTFVILDTVTLCLMISCVAASQLLIYRLTDGSWYDMEEQRNYREEEAFGNEEGREIEPQIKPPHTGLSSAMGRLVVDYGLEFSVARTTFDLGLVALLSAVAVRTLATFEASISLPIISLLGGTALLLGAAYLQSYIRVFRPLEKSQQRREVGRSTALANIMVPFFFLVAITAGVLSSSSVDGTFTTAATDGVPTQENTIAAKLVSYSSAAGKAKLKFVVDKIAEERAGPGKDSNSKKAFKPREKKSSSPKQDQSSRVVNEGKERMKQTQSTRKANSSEGTKDDGSSKPERREKIAVEAISTEDLSADNSRLLLKDDATSVPDKSAEADVIRNKI